MDSEKQCKGVLTFLHRTSDRPFGQLQNQESYANYSRQLQRFVLMLFRDQLDLSTPYPDELRALMQIFKEKCVNA